MIDYSDNEENANNASIIAGVWHEQGSAAQIAAELHFDKANFQLKTQTEATQFGSISSIHVSDRLGNIERKLTLPDGSVFSTKDNQLVDSIFKKQIKSNGIIHAIESNIGWVIVALVLTVVVGLSFFKWGVPAASHAIAHALPQKSGDLIGANTLSFLDKAIFDPSQLDEAQQHKIREHFLNSLLSFNRSDKAINYTLHFRAWGEGDNAIPNALALPSGDIILTDKFVELSKNQDEIDSVLLHEIGHIEHRHTLEMVVQSTLVTAAVALFTGDASGAADMGIGLGSLLVSTNYARDHESEADQYAFEKMLQIGIDPTSFADIMDRITSVAHNNEDEPNEQSDDVDKSESAQNGPKSSEDGFLDYFSTHPSTAKRIQQAKRYAQCYKKGLQVCDVLKTN